MALMRFGLATLAVASALAALAVPAAARNVYVTNSGSNNVSVINTATNTVTDTIGVGTAPTGIAITPDSGRAYIANEGSNNVSVVSTATNTVIDTIGVGTAPKGIAITPDGSRAYVANNGSNDVTVIDIASNTVIDANPATPGTVDPIPVGTAPTGIAITPDGSRAFVANNGTNDVTLIDTSSMTVSGTPVAVGAGPGYPAITPDGGLLVVPNAGSHDVSIVATSGPQPTEVRTISSFTADSEPHSAAITADGQTAYVTAPGSVSDQVAAISPASDTDQAWGSFWAGSNPAGIVTTPDRRYAYVANNVSSPGEDSVHIFDIVSNLPANPIDVGDDGPQFLAVVPDQGPVARFTARAGSEGESTTFDATASSDADGAVARYDWAFGDGAVARNAGPTPTHVYESPGSYTATLTVTDDEGTSTSRAFTGQTVLRNGSAAASQSQTVSIAVVNGGCTGLGWAARGTARVFAGFAEKQPGKKKKKPRARRRGSARSAVTAASSTRGKKRKKPRRRKPKPAGDSSGLTARTTVAYGRGGVLRGRVCGTRDESLAGVPIVVEARLRVSGSSWSTLASTTTEAAGSFAVAVPPGPSRKLRVAYPGSKGIEAATSREVEFLVRGKMRARIASARRLRPGQEIVVVGRLSMDGVARIPPSLLVVRQRETRPILGRSHWVAVPGDVRTRRDGEFRWSFRLRPQLRTRKLQIEVASRPDPATWPYLRARTKPMTFTVLRGPLG